MISSSKSLSSKGHLSVITIIVFLIYCNNLDCSWQLDDIQNILLNEKIHFSSLFDFFKNLHENSHQHLNVEKASNGRYIVFLTFAFNWLIGKDNITGYHLFNNILHIVTACLLYTFIVQLLNTKKLRKNYGKHSLQIAFCTTLLWATNPIQTQAITYIVQRMTSLSAMFSIAVLVFYMKYRSFAEPKFHFSYLCLALLCYILAIFSKENAVLIPGNILLIEIALNSNLSLRSIFKEYKKQIFLFLVITIFFTIFILNITNTNLLTLNESFETRYFTLNERILTEPRVLLFYLGLIFYPLSSNLSIEHDFIVSTSLCQPYTTFLSIFLILAVLAVSFFFRNRFPLLFISIWFFFYGHLIESTVLPLELVFEHRNYFPSILLFLPLSSFVFLGHWQKAWIPIVLQITLSLYIFVSSIGVISRNEVWKTPISLNEDALTKGATKARPYNNLAINVFTYQQEKTLALRLLSAGIGKIEERKNETYYKNYDNKYYILKKSGAPYKIIREILIKKLNLGLGTLTTRYQLIDEDILAGKYNSALFTSNAMIRELFSKRHNHQLKYSDQVYLVQHIRALSFAKKTNQIGKYIILLANLHPKDNYLCDLIFGYHSYLKSKYQLAKMFLKSALENSPDNPTIILLLLSIAMKENSQETIDTLWAMFRTNCRNLNLLQEILSSKSCEKNILFLPFNLNKIAFAPLLKNI